MVGNYQTHNGEWAVVGGTGEFGFAHGVATWEAREELEGANSRELRIHCVTLTFPKTVRYIFQPVLSVYYLHTSFVYFS